MSRYVLFGTLMWDALRETVAGRPVACEAGWLEGWHVARAADGDWPVLLPGGRSEVLVTAALDPAAQARFDFYERTFGYGPEAVQVAVGDTPIDALVYRSDDGGSDDAWSLDSWVQTHGARTLEAAREVMRAEGAKPPEDVAAMRSVIHARAHGVVTTRAVRRPVTVGGGPDVAGIDVHDVSFPYEGFYRLEEWRLDHPRFDGKRSEPIERAVLQVTNAATVLPYDPARDRVLVVEQMRMGALAKGDTQPWMIEPIAGLIDPGEGPETTALRELQEEAGLTVRPEALRFIARYYPSPGGIAQLLHSYAALCDLPDDITGLHGVDGEGEDIRTHLVPLDDLVAMITSGEAANAPLILSAQWLAMNRAALSG